MESKKWNVNVPRLITLLSSRMYSNVLYSGLKELITNSLDAKRGNKVRIQMWIKPDSIIYKDDGIGLSPEEFDKKFGEIASDHEREIDSRGFFGIGRLGLLSQSSSGEIFSYHKGSLFNWTFSQDGYSEPFQMEKREGNGLVLIYKGLHLEYDSQELVNYLREVFSIPLMYGECSIEYNDHPISSMIDNNYIRKEVQWKSPSNGAKINLWYRPESNGTKYICHKGIGVLKESFTGLTCFVDEDYLNIKTDREGFINDKEYKDFRQVLSDELSGLRPETEIEKMQLEFIQRLMKEFKRYWVRKKKEEPIQIPKEIKTVPLDTEYVDELKNTGEIKVSPETPEKGDVLAQDLSNLPIPSRQLDLEFSDNENQERSPEPGDASNEDIKLPIIEQRGMTVDTQSEPSGDHVPETSKVVTIRGAKPMDLGPDYPMVFFEIDPFTLVFNISHPTFKKLVERGTLTSDKLAIIFERMFECAWLSTDGEDLEKVKIRWAEVDKNLMKLFK